jgi:hypothetical protein
MGWRRNSRANCNRKSQLSHRGKARYTSEDFPRIACHRQAHGRVLPRHLPVIPGFGHWSAALQPLRQNITSRRWRSQRCLKGRQPSHELATHWTPRRVFAIGRSVKKFSVGGGRQGMAPPEFTNAASQHPAARRQFRAEQSATLATEIATERRGTRRERNGWGTVGHSNNAHGSRGSGIARDGARPYQTN